MYKIIEKIALNDDVDLFVIEAPLVAKNTLAGNFVIVRVDKDGERIPLTIVENTDTSITVISQKVGFSTKMLSKKNIGEYIEDVVGPLGVPAEIKNVKKVIAVAGGVGAAPIYPQIKAYYKKGTEVDLIIGASNKQHLILLDKFQEVCKNIYIATDDGSIGEKGFVTKVLQKKLEENTYDLSIAIGPVIMMKNVVEINKKFNLKTFVSLNPIMIDGTGMCGNCRVTIHNKTYFACVDGPDFDSDGIDFNELIQRQKYYHEEEHECNLRLGEKDD
ncbi:MAG: sulfide/dihydroorotate dehydrogenase-like FAD/NAD-binding protein [Candidatus Izemoplasmatales bacterium]|nr:sulfide/dihydroorotate dehydrogenase-like FAD/NAD-binding protein [Candidatus Izemoplasmatales bacterium]MDD4069207.1 sulfide/dihydroorotate dehydrogenase-like FAD/NAD-binding protein [Candidatus Izemoplasmatales bacterium]